MIRSRWLSRHLWHAPIGFALLWTALVACGDADEDDDDDATTVTMTGSTGGSGGTSTGTAGSGGTSTGTGTGAGDCGHAGEAEPGPMQGMTAAHNAVRCAVDPASGGPLPPLQWSSTVAAFAQSWADTLAGQGCPLQHSGGQYGENIFSGSGSYSPNDPVSAWASEESCFSYGAFPGCCSCTCGHYTQIVWRNSVSLGCAKADCPGGGEMWVCDYDPPGNFLGQDPY